MKDLAASAGGATDAVKDTTGALGGAAKAAKKLKDYTMGFDELNVIKPQDESKGGGGGAGGGGIGGDLGLDINSLWTDEMIASADAKAKAIAENILTALRPIKEAIEAIDFKPLTDSLSRLWKAFKPFAAKIGEGLYWFLMNVMLPLAGYTIENVLPDFINLLATGLEAAVPLMERFGTWIVKNQDSIVKVAGYVAAFFLAFKGVSLLAGVLGGFTKLAEIIRAVGGAITGSKAALSALTFMFNPVGNVVKVVTGAFTSFSTVLLPIAAVVAVVASTGMVLAANWDKVVETFKNFIDNIDLKGKFDAIMAALAPMMEKLAGLKDLFAAIGTIGAGVLAVAMGVVAGVFDAVLSMLPGVIAAFGGLVDILSGVGVYLLSVLEFFGSMVMGVKALIEGDFAGAKTIFLEAWKNLKDGVLSAVGLIFSGVTDVFAGMFSAVIDGVKGFFEGVVGWFKSLWDTLVGHSIVPDMINAIVEWFASLPGKIYSGLQAFVQSVIDFFKNMWTGVTTTWQGVADWFGTLFKTAWTNIQNAWANVKSWFSTLWTNIKTVFNTVGTWFKTQFTTAWTNIKTAWSSVKTWFGDIWTGIKNKFSSVGSWFKSTFQTAWTNIKNVFSGWASFFSGLWTKIKNTFSGLGTSLGNAIGGSVKTAINGVLATIESTVNKAVGLINGAIGAINKLPGVSVKKLSTVKIPRLATGGFVDEGQLFIAREAGAEMVGSMNNRTTVANNDQIVEGISAGVYSAVLAAMSQTNGNNKSSINVYLDGRQITAAVEKHQRERGANIMTGGVTFGY